MVNVFVNACLARALYRLVYGLLWVLWNYIDLLRLSLSWTGRFPLLFRGLDLSLVLGERQRLEICDERVISALIFIERP